MPHSSRWWSIPVTCSTFFSAHGCKPPASPVAAHALKRCVMTLPQELQPPQPLVNIALRPRQQQRVLAEHPFQRFERRIAVNPWRAETDRNLCHIGKTGFQRSTRLTVHHGDVMPAFKQTPSQAVPMPTIPAPSTTALMLKRLSCQHLVGSGGIEQAKF